MKFLAHCAHAPILRSEDAGADLRPEPYFEGADGEPNREPTQPGIERRRPTSSDSQCSYMPLQTTVGDVPRRRNCASQGGVTGSNPVAPTTRFSRFSEAYL